MLFYTHLTHGCQSHILVYFITSMSKWIQIEKTFAVRCAVVIQWSKLRFIIGSLLARSVELH